MTDKPNPGGLSAKDLVVRGTVIALVVAVPSVSAFLVGWTVLDDLLQAAIVGAVVHFVAMGFSLRFSKRFLVRGSRGGGPASDDADV